MYKLQMYRYYPSPPFFPHRVSLCSNGWPRAPCIDQTGFEITVILLSLCPLFWN